MSVPQSTIYIVSDIPLDNRYEHTLYFSSDSDQRSYFRSKVVKTFTGYTYLRKNWSIKVEASIAEAHRWTYLFFQNPTHERKWYYYFINKVSYVNDSTVELDLELDVLQTYRFDWELKECLIDRETVEFDGIGDHTLEEGLETGPLICADAEDIHDLNNMCIMVLSTMDYHGENYWCNVYDGVFSGLGVFAVDYSKRVPLAAWLRKMSVDGTIDAVVSMWMYPKNLVSVTSWDNVMNEVTGTSYDDVYLKGLPDIKGHLFEGYEPRNNKLYCYPFNFMYVTNNAGDSATYRYERFNTSFPCFGIAGAVSPESGVKLYPYGYNVGSEYAGDSTYEEGISLPSYPTCAWFSDTYKVWLAQTQNTRNSQATQAYLGLASAAVGGIASAITLDGEGYAKSLISMADVCAQYQQQMAQKKDMAVQPNQARGLFSGTVNVANGKHTFTVINKCISREYAESIDSYFDHYGYKVNRIGIPKICVRPRYTYVKTVGCTLSGPIGSEDRIKIQSIFDKGVTWWADTDNPCDYTAANKEN